ncbi:MAG: DUF21 domain-containing protein [Candidatus Pacebacteria bacterium]|nr:DUF21 domain-containing protein [Candidatus Paceibacterota bacterium]
MIEFLILTFAVIIASGIFSGIEAALFSVSQARALVLKEQGIAGADALVTLKTNLQQAIIVIVIGNNIVNIAGSLFVGVVAVRLFGDPLIGLISALLTLLIIIFGEILPKTIGENNAEKSASLFHARSLDLSLY